MDNEMSKRYAEVYEILKYLCKDDYNKIPKDVLEFIEENRDKNHKWKVDKSKKLYEQKLHSDTVAILSYLNMEFIVTKEQKEYLEKMHKFYQMKENNGS